MKSFIKEGLKIKKGKVFARPELIYKQYDIQQIGINANFDEYEKVFPFDVDNVDLVNKDTYLELLNTISKSVYPKQDFTVLQKFIDKDGSNPEYEPTSIAFTTTMSKEAYPLKILWMTALLGALILNIELLCEENIRKILQPLLKKQIDKIELEQTKRGTVVYIYIKNRDTKNIIWRNPLNFKKEELDNNTAMFYLRLKRK